MRSQIVIMVGLMFAGGCLVALGGPVISRAPPKQMAGPILRLSPENFRCIIVGDSQTASPGSNRVRTQTHYWDAPTVGEQMTVGNASAGIKVNNSTAGIANLLYSSGFVGAGWPNGGPNDFFAVGAGQWTCGGDILQWWRRIGQYRLYFDNDDSPWDEPWGIGEDLVARIAVRTSPDSVAMIATRAERGGVVDESSGQVHVLNQSWGVQIIEQPIPAGFNPTGDDVGVGLYFVNGSVEQPGEVLQVLGVVIDRVDPFGNRVEGTLVGYMGQSGWDIQDHLESFTPLSRTTLIEMIDAEYIVIMLGHNQESGGIAEMKVNLPLLVDQWESSFEKAGRPRPTFIFVVPWTIISATASPYLLEVESTMSALADENRKDIFVSYLPIFDYQRPDLFDPSDYELDDGYVHPEDISTARNLAEDLFDLLFEDD